MVRQVVRVGALLVCAYISGHHMADRWWIGPAFGVVVLLWQPGTSGTAGWVRNGLFFAASTLIYALVVMSLSWWGNTEYEIYFAVALGTILLPLAHALLLRASWKRAGIAIPGIYAAWYALGFATEWFSKSGPLGEQIGKLLEQTQLVHMASMWQVPYLAFMFCKKGRGSG